MELGGNAPFLVLDDADVEAAVSGAMIAKMRNGGEACTAANRFYVHEKVRAEFEDNFVAAMKALKVGPGLVEGVDLGPLIDKATRDKAQTLVDQAVSVGAKVLTGGRAFDGPGFFYPPTVLSDIAPGVDILREEIFGPVAPIVSFSSEDEAIASANDTEYGLVSYFYTNNLKRGMALAERLEAGMVALNRGIVSDPAAPFGGMKQCGLGREGGHEGMLEYVEKKYIAVE
jgi:succinate-semialdehyde dehydrogenase/glutarate-semialdehyde dehydrogenase